LQSTNGTFARVSKAVLKPNQVLYIGSRRYAYQSPDGGSAAPPAEATGDTANMTKLWQAVVPEAAASTAWLSELGTDSEQRLPMTAPECWLGSDRQQCQIVLDDPMVDARHARLFQDDQGKWYIEDDKSTNGVWAQIDRIGLGKGGYFQCGEQRFLFQLS